MSEAMTPDDPLGDLKYHKTQRDIDIDAALSQQRSEMAKQTQNVRADKPDDPLGTQEERTKAALELLVHYLRRSHGDPAQLEYEDVLAVLNGKERP